MLNAKQVEYYVYMQRRNWGTTEASCLIGQCVFNGVQWLSPNATKTVRFLDRFHAYLYDVTKNRANRCWSRSSVLTTEP